MFWPTEGINTEYCSTTGSQWEEEKLGLKWLLHLSNKIQKRACHLIKTQLCDPFSTVFDPARNRIMLLTDLE